MDRAQLTDLLRTAGRRTAAQRLTGVDADALAAFVLDRAEPSSRRRYCALALAGRVPPDRAAGLMDRVRSTEEPPMLRGAILGALSTSPGPHHAELLAVLHRIDDGRGDPRFPPAVLAARASLGDLSAVAAMVEIAADPVWFPRNPATAALEALVAARGPGPVLAELGATTAADLVASGTTAGARVIGVRLRHAEGGDLAPALADPVRIVARVAHDLMVADPDDRTGHPSLLDMVQRRGTGWEWALAVLARRGHRPDAIPRVALPGVPADVREAVVRRYAPGQAGTDARWLVEAALLGAAPAGDGRTARAVAALAGAGLHPSEPRSAGEEYGTGSGTYEVIGTDAGDVVVSTLGRFVRGPVEAIGVLERAGFRHVDNALENTLFEGLCVYAFGRREPLTVGELLFRWQD